MANIDIVIGKESHSSNWGKYYVKGLEAYQVREGGEFTKHESYTDYACVNIPDGTIFTIFEQSGTKRGTDNYYFSICRSSAQHSTSDPAAYGSGKCSGEFEVLLRAEGNTKAPRLLDWWQAMPEGTDPIAYIDHCAQHIEKRGCRELPPMPQPAPEDPADSTEAPLLSDSAELWVQLRELIDQHGFTAVAKTLRALEPPAPEEKS